MSESNKPISSTLTSDERMLFRKLARRLWVIGLGLIFLGT